MVLRKRRYRDLKKVGIGGFLAKTRAPKTALNGKKEGTVEDDQKKRPTWRPKKNKILVQYPEYIQDSFFGKDFMANCPDRVDEEELLIDADKRRIVAQDDGTAVQLNRDALAALEEMKAREEAARKEKEQELADARAAAEAAAKQAAVKARLAQEQLDELKKAMAAAGSLANGTDSKDGSGGGLVLKEDEKAAMDEDDLMLPSDLFGDELFKCLPSGGDLDIDDSALDEAETEGGAADSANGGEEVPGGNVAHSELEEGLRDMLGPDFNTKDMEDILSGFVENDKREAAAVRIKSEAEIKTEPGGGEGFDGNTTGGANTAGDIGSFSTPSASSESTVATDFIKQELISSSPSTSSTTPVAPGGEFVASAELGGLGRLNPSGQTGGPSGASALTGGGQGQPRPAPPPVPTPAFGDGPLLGGPGRLAAPMLQQPHQPAITQQQQASMSSMVGVVPSNPGMMGPRPALMTSAAASIDPLTGGQPTMMVDQQLNRLPTGTGMLQSGLMQQQQQQQHPSMMMPQQQQQQHMGLMQQHMQQRMQQPGMQAGQMNRMMMPGQQQQPAQQTMLGQQVLRK